MFGFSYLKASPTTHVLLYKGGQVVRDGLGLSFFYYAPTSSVVQVPIGSVDVPFAFEEVTADFQVVTAQGQLTYRVNDPKRVAALLDFSVNSAGRHVSDDPQKLSERIVNAVQVLAAALIHQMKLRDLLSAHQATAKTVLTGLHDAEEVKMLGIEILGLAILSIKPTPETAKALEADVREQLLRQADEAIYARRNSAVEQERMIKESELNTDLAVAEKQRQIREKKMAADIANEEQRAALITKEVQNARAQADAEAYRLEATLKPLRQTDWRVLLASQAGHMDPRTGVALAVRELAENASKIGELNISPDLLTSLMRPSKPEK